MKKKHGTKKVKNGRIVVSKRGYSCSIDGKLTVIPISTLREHPEMRKQVMSDEQWEAINRGSNE
jgi:hypothetical protein